MLIFWADFFITSYEKSPCDSIGGVVKHLLANPSLRSLKEPTDTPEKLFLCCKYNIKDVRFLFVSHSDVENHVSELPCMMYLNVRGARSYHRYVSTSISTFEMRRASFCHKHNPRVSSSKKNNLSISDCLPGNFIVRMTMASLLKIWLKSQTKIRNFK